MEEQEVTNQMTDTSSWEDRALLSCFAVCWRNMGTEHYPGGRDGPGMSCWVMWMEVVGQPAAVESRFSRAKCLS